MGRYYTAQICQNGHVINSTVELEPNQISNYCTECGAKTIMECPNCSSPIRGDYNYIAIVDFSEYKVPILLCRLKLN